MSGFSRRMGLPGPKKKVATKRGETTPKMKKKSTGSKTGGSGKGTVKGTAKGMGTGSVREMAGEVSKGQSVGTGAGTSRKQVKGTAKKAPGVRDTRDDQEG